MIKDHKNRNQTPKKIVSPQINPKFNHPLPDFNYLDIYPTFNHIFSVSYCKPINQALQDIPLIMKDLTTMLSTHLQHFKDKANYFQPAIFLPFDSLNNFNTIDPKQLIMHAENTYVNLKKIVERL